MQMFVFGVCVNRAKIIIHLMGAICLPLVGIDHVKGVGLVIWFLISDKHLVIYLHVSHIDFDNMYFSVKMLLNNPAYSLNFLFS